MSEDWSPESGHRADADRTIHRINRERDGLDVPETGADRDWSWDDPAHRSLVHAEFGDDREQEAILPGFGEDGDASLARDDCGDSHPFVCDDCGQSVEFGRTCGMSVCARCAVAWVRDRAIPKAAKVRRVRKKKHQATPGDEHQKIHHLVVSPSLGWFYDLARSGLDRREAQETTREVVKDILDELRAQGVMISHSFRGADEDGATQSESDDRGSWKERLFSDREWDDDVREQLAWKPHIHAIVVSDWIEGGDLVERVEDETGWVIHRIADDNGVSLQDDGAMARALTYCISHADIHVRDENNQSIVREVGAFEGDIIKSDGRFTPHPADTDWADAVVRRHANRTLGLASGTTDCGAELPAVDDPDELARRILEDLYPDDDQQRDVDADVVLHHVSEGNIQVDVSSTDGGGDDVGVTDAFGDPIGEFQSGGAFSLPGMPTVSDGEVDGEDLSPLADVLDVNDDDCSCGEDHGDRNDDQEASGDRCDGTLIPLGEARQRGLLADEEWCRSAPHVDEAREVNREWDDDLDPWRAVSPGKAIGAG